MEKKYSMYSNGTVIAHKEGGQIEKASEREVAQYLASLLPAKYKGEKLSEVMFNASDGHVYGKYATKKIRKQVFANWNERVNDDDEDDKEKDEDEECNCGKANCGYCGKNGPLAGDPDQKPARKKSSSEETVKEAAQKDQMQPTDGSQEATKDSVPRNESKAKPEESAITKDRPDVASPDTATEDNVPRSKNNGGIEGGIKVTFEKEESESATSNKPDTYVQKLQEEVKPTAAGNEKNHTAGTEIKFRSDSEIYHNLKLAKEEIPSELKEEKRQEKTPADKSEKTTEAKTDSLYTEAKAELLQKSAEINKMKIREARMGAAIKYALALLKVNPVKYANADTFTKLVEDTASKMSVESINEAIEGLTAVQKEAESLRLTKEASPKQEYADGGLATAIVIPGEFAIKTAAKENADELKEIFMSGTHLGRLMNDFDKESTN